MNYYLDTEFIEGTQKERKINNTIIFIGVLFMLLAIYSMSHYKNGTSLIIIGIFTFLIGVQYIRIGLSSSKTKPTIDLISIGIVSEDNREYYAISKDFNLKEAWNRYDKVINKQYPLGSEYSKDYWIRDNILLPIAYELAHKDYKEQGAYMIKFNNINEWIGFIKTNKNWEKIWYKRFKELIQKYGKTNKEIANEIKHFIANRPINSNKENWILEYDTKDVKFYGYYADYDWVVFCWLFGKMINLPKGFPKYCIDIKQILDNKINNFNSRSSSSVIKNMKNYPKQINEHNALEDAKWNKKLYKFISTI